MKKLYIIRHAKSSWENFTVPDFDRPLNDRGKADAPEMAKRLIERKIKIDAFVSSPAKRAKKTAKLFAKAFDVKEEDIILLDRLYEASVATFFEVVTTLSDKFDSVAIFSHNPGITDFVNRLCNARVDNMPTSSVFAIEIDIKKWHDFKDEEKKFLFFDYPKNHD